MINKPRLYQTEFDALAPAYAKRLRHPRWQRNRLEAMQAADWQCMRCHDTETPLEVHHIAYRPGAEPWEYPLSELRVLCERCHEFEHVPVFVEGCCMSDCHVPDVLAHLARPCQHNQSKCWRYLRFAAILAATEERVKKRIFWLNDHKGILTVCWRFRPSKQDQQHVAHLWATVGHEDFGDDYVEHTIKDA